ncbi:MAG: hypothetical protein K2W95_22565 [Candidatus Obscuribacterales bacterium]|nr:hypothetical protein [Candidatus Obscuribacterales bacterium]
MEVLKSRSSEIVLVLMLVLLFTCIRVYYGGEQAFMIVWKGELSFADTLVSLEDMIKMPRTQLQGQHRSVFYQLEEMGYLDDSQEELLQHVRKKNRARKLQLEGKRDLEASGSEKAAAPNSEGTAPATSTSTETKNDSQAKPGDDSGTVD